MAWESVAMGCADDAKRRIRARRAGFVVSMPIALFVLGCGGKTELDLFGSGGAGGSGATGAVGGHGGVVGGGGVAANGGGGIGGGGVGGIGGTGGSGGSPCVDTDHNPEHCGQCGHSCFGGECANGVCQPFVIQYLGDQGATALAIDATHVFWASPLTRAEKNGNNETTLAPAGFSTWGVAVDETFVYWSDTDQGVKRVNKDGSGSVVSLGKGAYRIAVDESAVYAVWDGVWKISKDGSVLVQLASIGTQGIALDSDTIYVTAWSPGGVYRIPKNGGTPVELAKADYSSYCAVYGDMLYWSVQGFPGGVYAVPKTGGAAKLIAAAGTPYGIAADAQGVYWTAFDENSVWMLPTGSTTPTKLADNQHNPRDLTIDEQSVYWTNDAIYSAVSRVAKPVIGK